MTPDKRAETPAGLVSLRVLIVDDNDHDAELMVRSLKREGLDVTHQRVDRRETLAAALDEASWDVILADHSMPHLDSFGVIEEVRRAGAGTPIVLVSGQIGEENLARALREGIDDYVSKDHMALVGGIVRRVLASHEARRQLEEAQWQLRRKEKLATLGTFVRGVAHEINNPLSYMLMSLEMIQQTLKEVRRAPELPAAQQAALDETIRQRDAVQRGAERIAEITRGLGRIAHSGEGARSAYAVNDLVARSMPSLPPRIRVDLDLASEARVKVNETDFRDVINALVQNACEAMSDAAEPSLAVRTRDAAEGRVVIEVADRGHGIPSDVQHLVFTPFFTTKPTGVGLSLSIVNQLVQENEGALAFDSTPGRGTTFRVTLPAQNGAAPAAAPREAVRPGVPQTH